VWVVKSWDAKQSSGNYADSLKITTLVGNPIAHEQNKRFVDQDLNRCFSLQNLQAATQASSKTVEQQRALELNAWLGPKQFLQDSIEQPANMDLIVDLHTTTADMGVSLIVGQGDVLTTTMASYVVMKMRKRSSKPSEKIQIMMHTHDGQDTRPNLSSIARHAFTIEVGAVPQGVIRHDKTQDMQNALELALECLTRLKENVDGVVRELQEYYGGTTVPCYRSAPAQHHGEMSAKLVWPSLQDNPNFPAYMVHSSLQDQDFTASLHQGDPLFVDLQGNVIEYDGRYGSPITLMFINEGGYYFSSSGTGISVAQPDRFDLLTGTLVQSENDDEEEL
jgi:aspartoacylase